MTNQAFTLRGHSDDVIVVEGLGITDEFYPPDDGDWAHLVFNNGGVVAGAYCPGGAEGWRFRSVSGPGILTVVADDDEGTDDVATYEGKATSLFYCGGRADVAAALGALMTQHPRLVTRATKLTDIVRHHDGSGDWWVDMYPADRADLVCKLAAEIASEPADQASA